MAIPAAANSASSQLTSSEESRRFLAALLSALLPGAGHFLVRRPLKALLLLLAFFLLFLVYWWLRLPRTISGIGVSGLALVGLCVLATWDAAYVGKRAEAKPTQLWLDLLLPTALFAGAAHFNWELRASGFRTYRIYSMSMAPALPLHSRAMVDCWRYHSSAPQPGDIIIFVPPSDNRILLVKRVIAVAGQTVEERGDRVLVNGHELAEPYAVSHGPILAAFGGVGPFEVPPGKIFVMGDSRNESFDSRMFGPVDIDAVRGKVIYMIPSLLKGRDAKTFD